MKKNKKERRKYLRYDAQMKVYYRVTYDIKTRVKFQILKLAKEKFSLRKYEGLSRNISVEGLCFLSRKKLTRGNIILLELYMPKVKVPVKMQGEVRWSKKITQDLRRNFYRSGVKLISVNGKTVDKTIHFDKKYKVVWSVVLESVFGSFHKMIKKLKRDKAKTEK